MSSNTTTLVPPLDPAQISAAVQTFAASIFNLLASKYTYVAAATVLAWDISVTFDQEVARVWKTRASLGRNLFFVNRYIPTILFTVDLIFQLQPSPKISFCRNYFIPSAVLGIVSLSTVQFILVLRTYALYQNKALLAVLTFLCVSSATTMMATTIYLFRFFITWPTSLPIVGCTAQCTDPLCRRLLTAFWIPFFVLETAIFVLTAYKSNISFSGGVGFKHASQLVTVVYRDGLVYYIVIMSISLTNLIVWIVAPTSLSYIATSLMRSLQITICSRILLNIRGMLEPKFATNSQLGTIAFGDRIHGRPLERTTSLDESDDSVYGGWPSVGRDEDHLTDGEEGNELHHLGERQSQSSYDRCDVQFAANGQA